MKLLLITYLTLSSLTAALSQTCYPTQVFDKSKGTTTTVTYDDAHNIVSANVKTPWGTMEYSAVTENTPTGLKKVFTLTKADPSLMAFALSKNISTYDKNNRLIQMEGSVGNVMTLTEKFIYSASGQLTQIDQASSSRDPSSGKISQDRSQIVYSYPSTTTKNPSEIKKLGSVNDKPGFVVTEQYKLTYDNNKAVSDDFPFAAGIYRAYSSNNIVTAEVTYANGTKVNQTYSYTFNAQGYPISKTYTFSGDSTTDTYDYVCQ